jgi:hypothetical protein
MIPYMPLNLSSSHQSSSKRFVATLLARTGLKHIDRVWMVVVKVEVVVGSDDGG